ncbi:glycosyltransferase family 2 protein [Mangrovibacterium marinum]|uniref:Glycosyl transferase family 2 n=1 Tax=Mangrovibacterium marinum TaxID=1639118 RepID=A0A2T5BZZ3_9BACT|nr:glycosyltransferase [Mangrovibacterium marinum]PTN07879.1 glycosyl transferase family 2 [Mangrovibacterium marinum]
MSFADRYIERNINSAPFVTEAPRPQLRMVVVVPVYNEPELCRMLNSLEACNAPAGGVEVLLVINESEIAPAEAIAQNNKAQAEVAGWKQQHPACFFALHIIRPKAFRRKHAGVGMARKTGMDEAIRRFGALDRPDGILISLDADTLVAANYFTQLEKSFAENPRAVGATICFQHRIDELDNARQREGMHLYELYLHYYKQALAFTGFPHAIYTVGSAFAVRAEAYVKQGGMSKRQAGEDFYFLHKLTAMGPIVEINSTAVYPSARLSNRVPFGTGPSLQKWVDGDESLRHTYAFSAFADLHSFFQLIPGFWQKEFDARQLPPSVADFVLADGLPDIVAEIRRNSASAEAFEKRFFGYFNAFKILKFLNYAHLRHYAFQDLQQAVVQLQEALG